MSRLAAALARGLSCALVAVYPRALRESYGSEIHETFVARLTAARAASPLGTARLLAREVGDSLRSGLRARLLGSPARSAFGGGRAPRHASFTERLRHSMDLLIQDLRFALRTLIKNPAFALTGILVLALGIGANTAIFSLVNGVLLEPLPFAQPERLLSIWETNPERGWVHAQAAAANYLDWAEQSRTIPDMALHADWLDDYALTGDHAPVTLAGSQVTGNFFQVLGVEAALGSTFEPADTWQGTESKVLLSHRLWSERFAGDPEVVGRSIELDGVARRVVGVAPAGLDFPFAGTDLWVPIAWDPQQRSAISFRRAHGYRVTGRLAPGAELDDAIVELQTIAARLQAQYPDTNTLMGTGVGPLHADVVGDTRAPLLVLLAAVGLVLLIACANVANMQLARSAARRREMAVRGALGASRLRLLRQGLTESLLLALGGGLAGLMLGYWGARLVVAMSPGDVPRLANVETDGRVVLFALGVTLLTTVLFGLAPAWRSSRGALRHDLADGGRVAGDRRAGRLSAVLVTCEIALALPLAIGAGLMARTLAELRSVELGFAPTGVLAVQVSLPAARYPDRETTRVFYRGVLERARALPGVRSAAISTSLPFVNQRWSSDFRAESWAPDAYGNEVRHSEISPGFFETLGADVQSGSDFDPADADTRLVALVNRSLVAQYFPDRDPIGERLCFDRVAEDCNNWFDVVGVVDDVRYRSLSVSVVPRIYAFVDQDWSRGVFIVLRADGDPAALVAAVRQLVVEVDPAIPLNATHVLDEVVAGATARERLVLDLLGAFSFVGVLLAALGIYAVVAYTTGTRTREIGIRMTLGARGAQVARSVLGRGLLPVALGVPLGLAVALGGTRSLGNLLFGVPATDPLTYAAVTVMLVGVAAGACYLPARRATRIDPVRALRQ